jgi:hypothetical protein
MVLSANIVSAADEFTKWWSVQDNGAIVDVDDESNYGFLASFWDVDDIDDGRDEEANSGPSLD